MWYFQRDKSFSKDIRFHVFIILGDESVLGVQMWFKRGQRGCRVLMVDNYSYNRNRQTDDKTYWICSRKVRFYLKKSFLCVLFINWFVIIAGQYKVQCSSYHQNVSGWWKSRSNIIQSQPRTKNWYWSNADKIELTQHELIIDEFPIAIICILNAHSVICFILRQT